MRRLALLLAAACCAAPAAAKKPQLPDYPYALRCAALTEAKSRLGGAEDRGRFDEAMFWGLAASESARKKARISAARFKQDQLDGGAKAMAELQAGDARALAQLEACRKQVPSLK